MTHCTHNFAVFLDLVEVLVNCLRSTVAVLPRVGTLDECLLLGPVPSGASHARQELKYERGVCGGRGGRNLLGTHQQFCMSGIPQLIHVEVNLLD